MSQWLNLSLGVNSFYKAPEDKLSDLNPYAVYGTTDLMGTGGDIIKLKRASDNAEQNFTEAELWGSAYDTFASGTTTTVTMLYDQVAGASASSNTHLEQVTASSQPSLNSSSAKSLNFTGTNDFLNSPDISTISDRPDFDGDITLATRFRSDTSSNTNYANPLFTYYQADTAGALNFVSVHSSPHRQLTTQNVSGDERFRADDFGANIRVAQVDGGWVSTTRMDRSLVSIYTSQKNRTIHASGFDAVNNTDDCGTISEGTITRFGIGGWRVQSTFKAAQQDFSLSCSCIFDRALSSDDQATLLSILDGLSV